MVKAYLVSEISQFSSYYFGDDVPSMRTRRWRNENDNNEPQMQPTLSIFQTHGTLVGSRTQMYLTDEELHDAHLHILLNCNEVQPYIE